VTLLNPYAYAAAGGGGLPADDFNRANAASLGTSSSGHTWVSLGAPFTIAGNAAHPPSGLADYTIDYIDAGEADVTIEVTITATPGLDFDGGIAGRVVDINNFVFFDISRTGSTFLTRTFQRVGGSFSGLTSLVNPVAGTPSDPKVVRLVLSGSGGESFIDGVSVGSFSGLNAALVTPTKHGFVSNLSDTSATYDGFAVT
jgi:hypothetical protein